MNSSCMPVKKENQQILKVNSLKGIQNRDMKRRVWTTCLCHHPAQVWRNRKSTVCIRHCDRLMDEWKRELVVEVQLLSQRQYWSNCWSVQFGYTVLGTRISTRERENIAWKTHLKIQFNSTFIYSVLINIIVYISFHSSSLASSFKSMLWNITNLLVNGKF